MKKTIVMLGVGSTYFTRGIIEALIRRGGEWDVRLVDIDPKCLEIAENLARRLVQAYDAKVTVRGSTERKDVLAGADAVVSTIGVGGRKAWALDMYVPRKFGIHQATADTYGAGGVSRSLRMIPTMVEVARDIERLCPKALFVNFSNPMGTCCRAMNKTSSVKVIGLCCGVRHYHRRLAEIYGAPDREVFCKAIGPNHFTWITEMIYRGRNILPEIRERMEKSGKHEGGPYTWDLFKTFDAFPCVGDGHIQEFVPGWQAKGAYYGKSWGVDAGHSFEEYAAYWDRVFDEMAEVADGRRPLEKRGEESETETFKDEDLFVEVLSSAMGEDEMFRTVNLPNSGQAANIPTGAILESTCLINGAGIQPLVFGDLPHGIAAIVQRIVGAQELTVEAALKADRKLVHQALIADLTVKTREDAEKLTDALLDAHRQWLPRFFE